MIRLAAYEDLDKILNIYEIARKYMTENGNATQWAGSYPEQEIIEKDIQSRQLFVYVEDDIIHGVFAFILGPEAAYSYIENGAWENDDAYSAIHRVASDGVVRGIFSRCVDFCKERASNLRIDTHHDNHTMQHVIEKNGFKKCGTIYVEDGTPRIAYQYSPDK